MRIEYPDKKIHNVECYRFCKARLDNGEEIYFIEYKDFTDKENGEFVDSYGIIENNNGIWQKTERKIGYDVLASRVVEELDPKTLGNYLSFANGYNSSTYASDIPQTQTQIQRQGNPPHNRNNDLISEFGVQEKWKPQTQTQRQEIPPKKHRPNEEIIDSEIIYIPLPTIDGKEERIDFRELDSNYITSNKYIPGFVVEIKTQSRDNITPQYSYSDECVIFTPYEISENIGKKISSYLKEEEKYDSFSIDDIPDMVIDNTIFRFVTSNMQKYKQINYPIENIVLPLKEDDMDIDEKDMLQRFMSGTVLGYFEMNGASYCSEPKLTEKDKANLFTLMAENSRLKAQISSDEIGDMTFPKDSYELETYIEKIKKENKDLKEQLTMTPEQRKEFKEKAKREKELAELKSFSRMFSAMGADSSEEILENNFKNDHQEKQANNFDTFGSLFSAMGADIPQDIIQNQFDENQTKHSSR